MIAIFHARNSPEDTKRSASWKYCPLPHTQLPLNNPPPWNTTPQKIVAGRTISPPPQFPLGQAPSRQLHHHEVPPGTITPQITPE